MYNILLYYILFFLARGHVRLEMNQILEIIDYFLIMVLNFLY